MAEERRDGRLRAPGLADILTGAAELFQRKGVQQTTMQDVAEHLAISKPTLYVHARSKTAILEGIFERVTREGGEVLKEASEHPIPAERVRLLLAGWTRLAATAQPHYNLFINFLHELPPASARYYMRWQSEAQETIRGIIRDGQRVGAFRADLDPTVVSFAIVALPNWATRWYSPDGQLKPDDVAEQFWQLLGFGLVQRSGD